MTPLPDAFADPGVAPSMLGAVLRVSAALVLLAAAAWAFLRWRGRGVLSKREIKVVDRCALARGAGLAVVTVSNQKLLLSVSSDGARLITTLDETNPRAFDDFLDESVPNDAELAR